MNPTASKPLLLVAALLLAFVGSAQSPADIPNNPAKDVLVGTGPPKFSVHFDLSGPNEKGEQLESLFRRELQTFKDVEIVGKKEAAFHVSLVAVVTGPVEGRKTGLSVALKVDRPQRFSEFFRMLQPNVDKITADALESMARSDRYVINEYFGLFTGPEDELKQMCSRLVSSIDVNVFEPDRRQWRMWKKIFDDFEAKRKEANPASPQK